MVLPPPPTIDGSAPPQTAEVEEGLQAIAETIDLSNARKKTTESSLDRDFALRQNLKRIRKGSIIVDGSNISKMIRDQHHDESPPSLDCVLGMVERLKKLGIPEEKIVVYFDASTEKEFQAIDPDILVPYKNRELFRVASSGEPLDDSLVSLGRLFGKKNFLVISTDRYREYPPWFQQHRVGATLDPNNCPFLAYPLKRLFQMYFRGEDDA